MATPKPTQPKAKTFRKCALEGCESPLSSRGYCNRHYLQVFISGRKPTLETLRHDTTVRDSEGRKMCVTCKKWLPESKFHKSTKCKDGFASTCAPCTNWRVRGFHRHGLTESEYRKLIESQGGKCVCGAEGPFVIDHDHSCCPGSYGCPNCVRGALCQTCNSAIGFVRDDAGLLRKLAKYLEEGGGR